MKTRSFFTLIFTFIFLFSCNKNDDLSSIDFRQEMRDFVIEISNYAKSKNPNFIIIPQNGAQILSAYKDRIEPATQYINAIDAQAQEDLLYGYEGDDKPTDEDVTLALKTYLDLAKSFGKVVLVTDYCSTPEYINDSYERNNSFGYLSYAAISRELDVIPSSEPYNVNTNDIDRITDAKNFLYLIDPHNFASAEEFISALEQTDYDIIIMDAFFDGDQPYTIEQIQRLKAKNNSGKRLVIAYMSIGEAEDYRYYWDSEWEKNPPQWLEAENPLWRGNYKVRYWESQWKDIIYGSENSYLDKILSYGFDGVYLDIIDAFEYFEEKYQ